MALELEYSQTTTFACGGHARLIDLQTIPSSSGVLTIAEASRHIGFNPHRAYFLTDVPEGGSRGGHGHKQLRQCFICLKGSVTIEVTKADEPLTFTLDSARQALVVDAGCWRELYDFSEDAVVMVLASEEYDESDYIRELRSFQAWEAERASSAAPIPYLDLSRSMAESGGIIETAVSKIVRSGSFVGGAAVANFEAEFARYCGAGAAVGVANGLEALSLTLRAWGVGPGDEVIVPAHTFVATALAVEELGATTVLVDVEPDTGLISIPATAAAITPRTKAIIPVHLYGHPVDMDALKSAVGARPIRILEDAAQAHGARYKGRPCGSLGDAAGFSFYPTKNLGALGDGGCVTSSDAALCADVRRIANYGASKKYLHEVVGVNSRLDALQAAVLSAKLPRLNSANGRRRMLAAIYLDALSDVRGLQLPVVEPWAEHAWHVFWVRSARRDALQAHLAAAGVGTNIHYPLAVHEQPCFAGRWRAGQFPVAEAFCREALSLPLDPTHSPDEIRRVAAAVRDFFARGTVARELGYG